MNDFTKKYAELISRYVDIDDMEHFHEDFEELLDAYENGDDEPDDFTGKKPKADEIYYYKANDRYIVIVDAENFGKLHLTKKKV
ncbi:MAG: hypothetical protein IKD80_04620 [Selenomonadaceae bacterium]|nr:hypothetical protein [Selenomonadaceae bacterium]